MLNNGFLYVHKRDRGMRPIIIMNVSILKTLKGTLEELVTMNNFLTQYVIDRIVYPGKAEALTTIIDMRDVGASEIPVKNLKGIISAC